MGFEDDLKKLEKVVDDLHSQELSLEKSIKMFEDGVNLAEGCIKELDSMRKKIEVVGRSKDGKIKIKPLKRI